MKHQSKVNARQQEEQQAAQTHQEVTGREFSSPEELLRFDKSQTIVPPTVEERLRTSLADAPAPTPPTPWWKKLLGGS